MALRFRGLIMLAAFLISLTGSIVQAGGPDRVVLDVPHRSQLDGTVWASSNCGPTTIGMVLEAFGQMVPTRVLRDRANQLLGIADPNTGTRIQDLTRIVEERGLSTFALYEGKRFRRWTPDDVRREVREGRPVIPQVYFPLLPNHRQNPIDTDHYIAIVGISGDDFIFNDSADRYGPGYRQTMTAEDFTRAWKASKFPFAAFSVGPGARGRSLLKTPDTVPLEPQTPTLLKLPTEPAAPAAPPAASEAAQAPSMVDSPAAPTAPPGPEDPSAIVDSPAAPTASPGLEVPSAMPALDLVATWLGRTMTDLARLFGRGGS